MLLEIVLGEPPAITALTKKRAAKREISMTRCGLPAAAYLLLPTHFRRHRKIVNLQTQIKKAAHARPFR
jgi:hypothetical protein